MSYSASHLLNFTYERPVSDATTFKRRSTRSRAYDKEHFLRAKDYIDEVCLSKPAGEKSSSSCCPICLDEMRIPKITKCGHMFCTTCILRHLHPYETHRCPMCFHTVSRHDLRPLDIITTTTTHQHPEVNERMEMVLLSRVKGTLNPKRVDASSSSSPVETGKEVGGGGGGYGGDYPKRVDASSSSSPVETVEDEDDDGASLSLSSFLPLVGTEDATFARLVLGSREMQASRFSQEEQELREILQEHLSDGEDGFVMVVEEALRDLEERRRRAFSHLTNPPTTDSSSGRQQRSPSSSGGNHRRSSTSRPRGESGGDELVLQFSPDQEGGGPPPGGEREAKASSALQQHDNISHFFQSSDGQYVFLHPFNMKCLMAEAEGRYSRLPTHVEGKVVDIENLTLTHDVRNRWPFLKHLPLYSQVQLVEMDIRLSDPIYMKFKAEISKRKQRRKTAKMRAAAQKTTAGGGGNGAGGGGKGGGGLWGYSDEALQEMRARREHVDLTGPLPWEASLMGEEKVAQDKTTTTTSGGGSCSSPTETTTTASDSSASSPDTPTGSSSSYSSPLWAGVRANGSFAEITKMNGHFPSLNGNRDFPSLHSTTSSGGGGDATTTTTTTSSSSSPITIGMSPPSIWASRNPLLLSSSPPQHHHHSPSSTNGQSPPVTTTSSPWLRRVSPTTSRQSESCWQVQQQQPQQQGLDLSSSISTEALGGGGTSTSTSESGDGATTIAAMMMMKKGGGGGGKKSKTKGISLFSTASQRKY